MTPVTLCPRCAVCYLGRPCPRRCAGQRGFRTLGAAIRWWRDWQEVLAA